MGNGTICRDLAAKVLMSLGLEENTAKTAAIMHLAATADTEGVDQQTGTGQGSCLSIHILN